MSYQEGGAQQDRSSHVSTHRWSGCQHQTLRRAGRCLPHWSLHCAASPAAEESWVSSLSPSPLSLSLLLSLLHTLSYFLTLPLSFSLSSYVCLCVFECEYKICVSSLCCFHTVRSCAGNHTTHMQSRPSAGQTRHLSKPTPQGLRHSSNKIYYLWCRF